MYLFLLGAILGCSLGIVFLSLFIKSKETDESACEVLRNAPTLVDKNLVASR